VHGRHCAGETARGLTRHDPLALPHAEGAAPSKRVASRSVRPNRRAPHPSLRDAPPLEEAMQAREAAAPEANRCAIR
jgi:hypothetical protein